jgi:hypothetical protein
MDLGHWTLSEKVEITEDTFGFIYIISCKTTNKHYIGKKQCKSRVKRKPLKGKTRNRIDSKESDWKTYTSSSNELNELIKKYGKENFEFKILRTCDSKWALAYYEAKEQFDREVLIKDEFLNGILNLRVGKIPKAELEKYNKTTK